MFVATPANELEELLELGDFDYSITAEGVQFVRGESALTDVTRNLSAKIIR